MLVLVLVLGEGKKMKFIVDFYIDIDIELVFLIADAMQSAILGRCFPDLAWAKK